ncbi:MAG: DNA mismatch repair protein MutS [Alphaproteobacteria bacterium]
MKVFLMYADRDFGAGVELPPNVLDLTKDLALNTLFEGMADGDRFLFDVARETVLHSLGSDLATVRYRQEVLKDCLKNHAVVARLYALAGEALEREKKEVWKSFFDYPSHRLNRSREALEIFMHVLRQIRAITDEHAHKFESAGFSRFFAMLEDELSDAYFSCVQEHLRELKFHDGVLISAELGTGNKGKNYILRKIIRPKAGWIERFFAKKPPSYTLFVHPRDESGARCLSDLRDQGIVLVANALARSTDHIRSFFVMLRRELAFYLGCTNLHERLRKRGAPTCFPVPAPAGEHRLSFEGLYDACLALTTEQRVVGNDVNADDRRLVIITGANRGGKSTFLRSVGLAQLMMQAGMFAPAESFRGNLCDGLFTHFKREEDPSMKSGKLDEELGRMSEIVKHITRRSTVLFNESFAATNEREGSEIASQIIRALLENDVKILFVTHLYEFAHRFCRKEMEAVAFLRAERLPDGTRPFKLIEGAPLATSYGEDLYDGIFGATRGTEGTDTAVN